MEAVFDPVAENEERYLELVLEGKKGDGQLDRDTLNAPLGELYLRPAVCVGPQDSIRKAVRMMKEAGIGSVLVQENDRLIGIFTERDLLMRVVDEELDIDRTPVGEVMSKKPETLGLGDALSFAINMMSDGGYRHVPVTDSKGRPLHVVSVRDVAAWLAECHPERVVNLPPEPGRFAARRHGA